MNNWKEAALDALHRSIQPVPQELNEIDWKGGLSSKTDRLSQHICAFANLSGGGFLVFGACLNDVNRLIDLPPHSRNEGMAQLMLQLDMCERRGSGYDRAVAAIEEMLLPAYKVQSGDDYTRVSLFPMKALKDMTKEEKVIACYQHACLLYENNLNLTNQGVRERFGLDKNKSSVASRIIADTVERGLLKISDEQNTSTKYVSYIPFYG